jgi:predicted nucleic acid-binding protein
MENRGPAIFLVDTSALVRRQTRPEVREALDPLLEAGEVATCGIVDLETLYTANSPGSYDMTATALREMARAPVNQDCVDRSLAVQGMLAERSQHRGVTLPDLLIAACAELAELIVLHYDADFDQIAAVTGQPTRWVVPRGSVS